jgi:hypothetical protein
MFSLLVGAEHITNQDLVQDGWDAQHFVKLPRIRPSFAPRSGIQEIDK